MFRVLADAISDVIVSVQAERAKLSPQQFMLAVAGMLLVAAVIWTSVFHPSTLPWQTGYPKVSCYDAMFVSELPENQPLPVVRWRRVEVTDWDGAKAIEVRLAGAFFQDQRVLVPVSMIHSQGVPLGTIERRVLHWPGTEGLTSIQLAAAW
jgi:hypothetical protein